LSSTWCATQKQRVWKPFPNKPNPLHKSQKQQHQQQGAQSKSGIVPKNKKKKRKNGGEMVKLGFGVYMEKMGNGGNLVAGDGCKWQREAGGGE
jgi:co-chaperonin GroES (HSP10)